MATDPNKKKDEELETPAPSTDTQETAPATPELNLEEKYKEAGKLLEESNTEAVNAISNSYGLQETAMGKILEEAETLRAEKQQLDETAQKRANAYRYITGIGDAISGIANLVGTAHGAANQEQHYNAPAVIQMAEASRKERKLEMDQLNERLRELKAQKGALAATKEMKLGEQRAKHAAEKAALELQKAGDQQKQANWKAEMDYRKEKDAEDAAHRDKVFAEGQRQFDVEQARLTKQASDKLANEKEIAQIKAQAAADKLAQDPKHQLKVLQANIVGVRDQLAKGMGYKDYNEYKRYQNVSGWGKDIDGQRNRESRIIRDERASMYPETEEFLQMLEDPSTLTDDQVRALMSASSVFADAVGKATEEPTVNPSNGKKIVW